jgi:hypothetical protein
MQYAAQPDIGVSITMDVSTTYPYVVNATGGPSAPYGPAQLVPYTTGFWFDNADCDTFSLTAVLYYKNGSTATVTGTTDSGMGFDASPDVRALSAYYNLASCF